MAQGEDQECLPAAVHRQEERASVGCVSHAQHRLPASFTRDRGERDPLDLRTWACAGHMPPSEANPVPPSFPRWEVNRGRDAAVAAGLFVALLLLFHVLAQDTMYGDGAPMLDVFAREGVDRQLW